MTLRLNIDPDSFRGKLWLLFIDKLVIGAIIGTALLYYNGWQREDQRSYEKQATEIQLKFERAKLLNQFLPIITDAKLGVEYRAYVLRSALLTKSLDAETGLDFGRRLLTEGLEHDHFITVMLAAMPEGLPELARRISGRQDWRERNAWRDLIEATQAEVEVKGTLESTENLCCNVVEGLFVALNAIQPGTNHLGMSSRVHDLSRSGSRGFRVVGNLSRVLFFPDDSKAAEQLGQELLYDNRTLVGIAYTRQLLRVLSQYGPPSGAVAIPIARLLTLPELGETEPFSGAREQHYEMRAQAGALLKAMQEPAERGRPPNTGGREAVPVLLAFIREFRSSVERAQSPSSLSALASKYNDPGQLALVAEILRRSKNDDATREVDLLRSMSLDKLRTLPGWKGMAGAPW